MRTKVFDICNLNLLRLDLFLQMLDDLLDRLLLRSRVENEGRVIVLAGLAHFGFSVFCLPDSWRSSARCQPTAGAPPKILSPGFQEALSALSKIFPIQNRSDRSPADAAARSRP